MDDLRLRGAASDSEILRGRFMMGHSAPFTLRLSYSRILDFCHQAGNMKRIYVMSKPTQIAATTGQGKIAAQSV